MMDRVCSGIVRQMSEVNDLKRHEGKRLVLAIFTCHIINNNTRQKILKFEEIRVSI